MNKIPVYFRRRAYPGTEKIWVWVERQRGSHVRLKFKSREKTIKLTVPLHNPLKKGTSSRILKEAGISVEELRNLLKK